MQVGASISTLARVATISNAGAAATLPKSNQHKSSPSSTSQIFRQQQKIRQLQSIDREVRAHEQAHLNAAAGIAVSGAHFQYQVGPDGKRYAVAGEVQIDTAPVRNNPRATLRKATAIEHAALAPTKPSTQDREVAHQASAMARQAQSELLQQQLSARGSPTPGQTINQYA
ncbi:MAG TPA: hypothetical protein ENI62_14170 [Gammaproteobacteria bacterium]|nr:hypothetical protein [Gammaproteobacteria bacterium]